MKSMNGNGDGCRLLLLPSELPQCQSRVAMSEVNDLHVPFIKFLKEQGIEYLRTRSDKRSTVEQGWPDFTLMHPNRGPLLIEFKQEKNSYLSAEQKKVHARLEAKSFRPLVIRSMDKAVEAVMAWQAISGPARGVSEHGWPLYRFRDGVFERDPSSGNCFRIRKATPEDVAIPHISTFRP